MKTDPAADVHQEDRRLVLDEFGVESDGGVPLWEQLHILDGYFVGDSFEPITDRLGRTQQVFPKGLFLAAKPGQRQSGGNVYGTLRFSAALFDLPGDGGESQQIVVVVLHFVAQDGLSAGPAHEELPAVLQRVLQGVRLMGILRDTGWERKMPGFDGVVAVVYADVHTFSHPFFVC